MRMPLLAQTLVLPQRLDILPLEMCGWGSTEGVGWVQIPILTGVKLRNSKLMTVTSFRSRCWWECCVSIRLRFAAA